MKIFFILAIFSLLSLSLLSQEICPNNEIWYISSDLRIVTPNDTSVFGTAITSNKYVNGKGIIRFLGNVKKIGEGAFRGCSNLVSISIPNSVTMIGTSAFQNCYLLEQISLNIISPIAITPDIFGENTSCEGVNKSTCTLLVPKGCAKTYAKAPVWGEFKKIKEMPAPTGAPYILFKTVNGILVKHIVELGKKYSFQLDNGKDGKITMVKFNGIDVTSEVVNNQYTTPVITENSEIYVEYDKNWLIVTKKIQKNKVSLLRNNLRNAHGSKASYLY